MYFRKMTTAFGRVGLVAIGVGALGLSGCQTLSKINPLAHKDPAEHATEGKRIPIAIYQAKTKPSDALAGLDYYLPAPHTVTEWSQPSGPNGGAVEHADAAKAFKVAWTRQLGQGSGKESAVLAQPVSDGKAIYVLDGEARVSAVNAANGANLWSHDYNPHLKRDKYAFGGGLAVVDGVLYFTSGFRLTMALDAASGKVLWKKDMTSPVHQAPVITEKYVVVTDVDNQVIAFDRITGEQAWTYQAIVEPARILKSGGGIYVDNMVYAPFSSGELVALDVNTGAPTWTEVLSRTSRTNALSEIRDISGHPIFYKDQIFAASFSGEFAALNAKTGQTAWSVTADSTSSPWPAGDVVFLCTIQGDLMAVSRDSGGVFWVTSMNAGYIKDKKASKKHKKAGPETEAAADDDSSVLTLPSGKLPVWTGPLLASNRLILVNSMGEMVTFDPKTGKRKDSLKLGGAAYIAPIIVGDAIFVLTDEAKLIAVR